MNQNNSSEYTIRYQSTEDDGRVMTWRALVKYSPNKSETLAMEYKDQYKEDKNFKIFSIEEKSNNLFIDVSLSNRMNAVRDICELGNKIRSASKVRNRQPLKNAYILFKDIDVHNYMVYLDGKKNEYRTIISEELNVFNVKFVDESEWDVVFDFQLKPNFKSLGPKGYGKQAQYLKQYLTTISKNASNELYRKLKMGEGIYIGDVPLTISNVEVDFVAKQNYSSAHSKSGTVILDFNMDEKLLDRGFAADFRSIVQGIRKDNKLKLDDRISLEVFCDENQTRALKNNYDWLARGLLAKDMKFFEKEKANQDMAHKVEIDNNMLYVNFFVVQ
jgi:isoleucyl-tRNA synthetase